MGGPADLIVSLQTYSEHASPLIFLSTNPDEPPSFRRHDASSFSQWREDAVGDHYVSARAVGPRGGALVLVNLDRFGKEELEGILHIKCSYIVAFDTLFWNHLRSTSVCPSGLHLDPSNSVVAGEQFCSGHGACEAEGLCKCDASYAGTACEHEDRSVDEVQADGSFQFQVPLGRYQYFRVRVPASFEGGFLEVEIRSEAPVIVLVRGDDLPDVRDFDLSNFDDWLNQRKDSTLKYKVKAGGSPGNGEADADDGEAVSEVSRRLGPPRELQNASAGSGAARRLQANMDCMGMYPGPPMEGPKCETSQFGRCKDQCAACAACTRDDASGADCATSCAVCTNEDCVGALAVCAGELSCTGAEKAQCDADCGQCTACFGHDAGDCRGCECCIGCLPLAAKCGGFKARPADYNAYVFVGIYAHPRGLQDRSGTPSDGAKIQASATIALREDPEFEDVPQSWVADLYDSFLDLRHLEITHSQKYPSGEQYIYNLSLGAIESDALTVRLYRDRMTLIEVENTAGARSVALQFSKGPNVTHVLSALKAPKTVFDFDQVASADGDLVVIDTEEPTIWCALFGAADGELQLVARTYGSHHHGLPAIGTALAVVLAVGCGLALLGAVFGGVRSIGERLGVDPSAPMSDRLSALVRLSSAQHESTLSLTRVGSMQGYVGSDVIDRSVEDQYLHRGGIGDDGI
ncbi:unnamed protein product [Prorocentrum cordatum]|uniref:EGF-like domain-containing protein n=1 Tax=Prorocentrum cordatum TaxID=2364126 RepID=A0ABN9U983_9DINO|nr:unnamed protein product [Polarella glacialis]